MMIEMLAIEHHQELQREVEKARLVREALSGHERKRGVWHRMMDWLGNRLAARPSGRPRYSAAEGAVPQLPVANRPQ